LPVSWNPLPCILLRHPFFLLAWNRTAAQPSILRLPSGFRTSDHSDQ
jgi:hypothetical protein